MKPAHRVAINTGILYARMGITILISLYTTRLILDALGADDFGIFNVVGSSISMLTFLSAAMTMATQRFMSFAQGEGDLKKQKDIFSISIVLHFVIGIIVVILLETAAIFFFNGILKIDLDRMEAAKIIYHFMVLSTFFAIISVPYDAVINAHEHMLLVAILGIIEALLKLGVAIYITITPNDKLISFGILMAAISILLLIIRRVYCRRKYEEVSFNYKSCYNKPLVRQMTSFAGWSFFTSSSGMVGQYGLGIVLNHFWGTLLNTAHGIAGQISGQLMAFSNTMLSALNPIIDKSEGGGNRTLMVNASLSGSKFSFILLAFFAVPFLIETPYVLDVWLKDVPEWAILFCRLQVIRNLIEQLTISIGSSVYAQGNISGFSKVRSVVNLAPIILSIILFNYGFPPYVLYIVWILCWSVLGGYVVLYFANKNCGISYSAFIKQVAKPSLLLVIVVFVLGMIPHLFTEVGLLRLFLVVLVSVLVHLLITWNFCLNHHEKQLILQLQHRVLAYLKSR